MDTEPAAIERKVFKGVTMEKVSDVLDFLPYILKMPSNRIWIALKMANEFIENIQKVIKF